MLTAREGEKQGMCEKTRDVRQESIIQSHRLSSPSVEEQKQLQTPEEFSILCIFFRYIPYCHLW